MSILFDEKKRIFRLDTARTSYAMEIGPMGYLMHLYYGAKVSDTDLEYLSFSCVHAGFDTRVTRDDGINFYKSVSRMEYSGFGCGDQRTTSLMIRRSTGTMDTDFKYVSHKIYRGKPTIPGLPATFAKEDEADTLEILCVDDQSGAEITLFYTAFANVDAITRHVRIKNASDKELELRRVFSLCVDFHDAADMDFIHLHGGWMKERNFERTPLIHGNQSIGSLRGSSSHAHNPFIALCSRDATEEFGDAYGFNFVYSGNYLAEAEMDGDGGARVQLGIHPTAFAWKLLPNEEFYTPEAVMVYSREGLGGMSRTFHRFYRKHLIRGPWKTQKRPILVNNWEATYFNFNEEKLLAIAKVASEIGIEMLVLDDGWFSHYRDNDKGGLGDWFVDTNKFPQGLGHFVDQLKKLNLKFGLWFEPEMISPNSDLYRAHPDWAIQIEGRPMSIARSQYVLDMTRADVRDYLFDCIKKVMDSTEVTYIKWDFNRNLTEVGSATLPTDRQGEVYHRYVLGLYELLDRITTAYPNLLLEHCSGGGGRFDPAMLYYAQQIWTSDRTDSIDRIDIQYGTSLCYPVSTMGAHVAKTSSKRYVSLETRGAVALHGTFGYEVDLTNYTPEDIEIAKAQCKDYHKYYNVIQYGDLYRLISPWKDRKKTAWSFVSEDKREALVTYVVLSARPMDRYYLRLAGLDPKLRYREEATGRILSGDTLMNAGICIPESLWDFDSRVMHFVAVDESDF